MILIWHADEAREREKNTEKERIFFVLKRVREKKLLFPTITNIQSIYKFVYYRPHFFNDNIGEMFTFLDCISVCWSLFRFHFSISPQKKKKYDFFFRTIIVWLPLVRTHTHSVLMLLLFCVDRICGALSNFFYLVIQQTHCSHSLLCP